MLLIEGIRRVNSEINPFPLARATRFLCDSRACLTLFLRRQTLPLPLPSKVAMPMLCHPTSSPSPFLVRQRRLALLEDVWPMPWVRRSGPVTRCSLLVGVLACSWPGMMLNAHRDLRQCASRKRIAGRMNASSPCNIQAATGKRPPAGSQRRCEGKCAWWAEKATSGCFPSEAHDLRAHAGRDPDWTGDGAV